MVEKPNEDSEPHVQFILRWVIIRKGVGASAQTGVRLTVSACWVTNYLMQYFKPVAGIIILIFVLVVLFLFIQSSLEENKRQSRLQEQSQLERSRASSYDSCVEKVDYDKWASESAGRGEINLQNTNGSFERAVSTCVASNPMSKMQYTDDSTTQMIRNGCESSVVKSILQSVNATPEEIEMKYQQDLRSCEIKYGQ